MQKQIILIFKLINFFIKYFVYVNPFKVTPKKKGSQLGDDHILQIL